MSPITRTFYYGSYTKEQDIKYTLPNKFGTTWSGVIPAI